MFMLLSGSARQIHISAPLKKKRERWRVGDTGRTTDTQLRALKRERERGGGEGQTDRDRQSGRQTDRLNHVSVVKAHSFHLAQWIEL